MQHALETPLCTYCRYVIIDGDQYMLKYTHASLIYTGNPVSRGRQAIITPPINICLGNKGLLHSPEITEIFGHGFNQGKSLVGRLKYNYLIKK